MTLGEFDLYETLADLASDEGADPIMLLAPMPPWWRDALVATFAGPN
jgi:hypothetical protein